MLNRTARARLAPKSTNPRTAVPVIVFDGVAIVVVVVVVMVAVVGVVVAV